jgi:hypothetical protein
MLKPYNKAEITFDLKREIGQKGLTHKLSSHMIINSMQKLSLNRLRCQNLTLRINTSKSQNPLSDQPPKCCAGTLRMQG